MFLTENIALVFQLKKVYKKSFRFFVRIFLPGKKIKLSSLKILITNYLYIYIYMDNFNNAT